MKRDRHGWITKPAVGLFGLFLLSFPRKFREVDGEEVRRSFGEGLRAKASERGLMAALGYALRGYGNTVVEGISERKANARKARHEEPAGVGLTLSVLSQDLRFGARGFVRRPGFTAVALLTLGLGIGAATALFSVVNGVLLRPFPYPDSGDLVVLWNTNPEVGMEEYRMAGTGFLELERSARSFREVAMLAGATASLTGDGLPPTRAVGSVVSANLFHLLGVQPLLGRSFHPEENQGTHRVVILSHGLWAGRFAGDPGIVGKSITMDGNHVQVVGVMPRLSLPLNAGGLSLAGPDAPAFWAPLDYTLEWVSVIGAHVGAAVARLEPGVTMAQAEDEMAALARAMEEGPGTRGEGIIVRSLRRQVVGDVQHNLMILLGAAGLLLLMACGNLANLLLARGTGREREWAVRAALGAGGARLARQILTEILLLCSVGGFLGLALSWLGVEALLSLIPSELPRQSEIGVDAPVLLFTSSAILLATLTAGLVPSIRWSRSDPARGLRAGGRSGTPNRERNLANRSIVTLQFALASILLVGAGLLAKSFTTLRSVDPGFHGEGVLTAQLYLPETRYGSPGQILAFYDELRQKAGSIPGVESAVLSMDHPLENTWWNGVGLLDQPPPAEGESPTGIFRPVSDGYFQTYDIPLLQGRLFDSRDRPGAPGVMVVNQAFADRYFPDGSPLGQRVRFTVGEVIWGSEAATVFEVVGVVGNVRFNGFREPSEPAFHIPLSQFPYSALKVHLKTNGNPESLIQPLRAQLRGLDPELPLTDILTMDQVAAAATAQDRFNAILLGGFALAALVLAASGIFGVLSYMVAQRTKEVGIRLALGAPSAAVLGMVVRNGATMAGIGLAGGLGASMALAPLLASLLFGVPPRDLAVFAQVGGILALVAFASATVPALRAARTDPVETLRGE